MNILWYLALACLSLSPLSGAEKKNKPPKVDVKKYTTSLYSQDYRAFTNWILEKNANQAKYELLVDTVVKARYPLTNTITWYKASLSNKKFKQLLKKQVIQGKIKIKTDHSFFSYKTNGAFWVDFANGSTFGGGFRSNGNVQEERMFLEFPQLAQLAFNVRNNTAILPFQKKDVEPFLVVNLQRAFDISRVPYGSKLSNADPLDVRNSIHSVSNPHSHAHVIGLVAKDWKRSKRKKYSIRDLHFHLKQALVANIAALKFHKAKQKKLKFEVHTGRWGAGAFKNSVKMLTAIQILAAHMSLQKGVAPKKTTPAFIFHSIRSSLIKQLQQEIETNLQNGITPEGLLNQWLIRQDTDSSWRPQK